MKFSMTGQDKGDLLIIIIIIIQYLYSAYLIKQLL